MVHAFHATGIVTDQLGCLKRCEKKGYINLYIHIHIYIIVKYMFHFHGVVGIAVAVTKAVINLHFSSLLMAVMVWNDILMRTSHASGWPK